VQAFVAGRNTGISVFQSLFGDRLTAGLGWYGNSTDTGAGFWRAGSNITGRVTWLPWAPCDCEHRWLEIGFSGSYRFDQELGVRYRVRPDAGLGPRIIDTGRLPAREDVRLGLETAFNYGRWGLQAECMGANPQIIGEEDPILWGWYGYVTYQLNGGTRRFRRSHGVYDKTLPCRNFDCSQRGHQGQWELALRYSMLDLEDEAVYGGSVRTLTLGVNWYLDPNFRIMFNYVHAAGENVRTGVGRPDAPSGRDGRLDSFAIRFSIFW
jgi:phosphate-selective porin OprO/OprP